VTDSVLPAPPLRPQRVVYFGTPEAAVPPLEALLAAGIDVPLVISRGPRRRGRRAEPTPSPVAAAAAAAGIPVSTVIGDAVGVGADCGVVVAFGRIIPVEVLAVLPMINVHFSLLPRWRGAAPVERAVLAGDPKTGVCVMGLEPALDTGPVYGRAEVEIDPLESASELRARLVGIGSDLLVESLQQGLVAPRAQVGDVTYADKIERSDLELRWDLPAVDLHRRVRVGGAWTTVRGRLLKVHEASVDPAGDLAQGELAGTRVGCAAGSLVLAVVQPEGRARIAAPDWVNGARLDPSERLGA